MGENEGERVRGQSREMEKWESEGKEEVLLRNLPSLKG